MPPASPQDGPQPADDGPEINPFEAPKIEVTEADSSPLIERLKRSSGNDLVFGAIMCSVFGWFVPFGFAMDFLSLFLLGTLLFGRGSPSAKCIVLACLTALLNLLRVLYFAWMIVLWIFGYYRLALP